MFYHFGKYTYQVIRINAVAEKKQNKRSNRVHVFSKSSSFKCIFSARIIYYHRFTPRGQTTLGNVKLWS